MSYHIGPRAGEEGPRPSAANQAEVKKLTAGKHSPQPILEDTPAEDTPHRGLLATSNPNPPKETRKKWTREEYKLVMEAYYMAVNNPSRLLPPRLNIKSGGNKTHNPSSFRRKLTC